MKKKAMPRSAAEKAAAVPVMNEVAERQTDTIASRPTAAPVHQRRSNNQIDGGSIPKASVAALRVPKSKTANAAIPKHDRQIQDGCHEANATSSESMRAIVLEVLSERRNPTGGSTSLAEMRSAKKPDRKGLREAVSILFRKPIAEITDAVLDEIIERIEAEAAGDAESVAANLNQLVAHLQTLNCTTRDAVVGYFAAAKRVLLELHAELRLARPSPTRLRQLAAQYALDPRHSIELPAHRIEIRPQDDGYEIALAPPGSSNLTSIPLPGTFVNDPFKRLLLGLVLAGPHYTDLMQLIEMLLGFVPTDDEDVRRLMTPATAVQVDFEDSSIIVLGRRYVVEVQLLQLLQLLLAEPGAWVSSTFITDDPLFAGVRVDRLCKRLPTAVQELIEGQRGKGYRLRFDRLERLCQYSSVAPPAFPAHDEQCSIATDSVS
jgi:hypothetical protein